MVRKVVNDVEKHVQKSIPVADGIAESAIKVDDVRTQLNVKMPRKPGDWVKVTPEQLAEAEANGTLHGWDPKKQEALIIKEA